MLEITQRVQQSQPEIELEPSTQLASDHRLDHVFEVLNM